MAKVLCWCVLGLALLPSVVAGAAQERADVLIADFEGQTYGDWQVEGEAFGPGPARGTLPRQMRVSGHLGRGLVNTFFGGDGTTGVLTSPPLRIERRYINFLIGGGMHPGATCMDLIVDGEVVRTATGPNDRPGGTEKLDWRSWDVSELAGKLALIRIVDSHSGGWGHVNIDHILASERSRAAALIMNVNELKEVAMDLSVEGRYVHFPVTNGAEKVRFRVLLDGQMVRELEVELAADGEPDWWAFYDVSAFAGRTLVLEPEAPFPRDVAARLPELIRHSDELIGADDLYQEALRPQFHFTPRRGWNNDPNGMVYYDGEYHLFFQHNPFGIEWGNMHWGHAVSTDMIHWRELPIALHQRSLGDMAFSGGGAVDVENTGGFKTGDEDAIVLAFTSTGRGECIAYSNDRGRTFAEYEGNPVVKHRGRDPKIVWYGPERKWVMIVFDEEDDQWRYVFYESRDLKSWSFMSEVPGFHECPEFFELPVDGDEGSRKWVVYGAERREEEGKRYIARSSYMVGTFDGRAFHPETGMLTGHLGPNYYAAQTFSNAPGERRIMMGWLAGAVYPDMPFSQGMTVPLELSLRTTPDGIRLFFTPVKEIEVLHSRTHQGADMTVEEANDLLAAADGELLDVRLELEPQGSVVLDVRGVEIAYDAETQELTCQGMWAGLPLADGVISLQILVDTGVFEVYGNDGLVGMSFGGALYQPDATLSLTGAGRFRKLEVHEMRSAWQGR